MANYTSQPIQQINPTSSIDERMLGAVMSVRQGQYTAAKETANKALQFIDSIQVIRPEDQEYINMKRKDMYQSLSNLGSHDLSKGAVADSYYSVISSVASDPIIVDAIGSTQNLRTFEKEMQELATKDPEKYNENNRMFAMAQGGYEDYINGKTNRLGKMTYTPYTNVEEGLRKKLKDYKDLKGDTVVQIRGTGTNGIPVGEIVEQKISGMTPEQMVANIPGLLTPQEERQMYIDGWGYARSNPGEVERLYTQESQTLSKNYDDAINNYKLASENTSKTSAERLEASKKMNTLIDEREKFIEGQANKDITSKAYNLYRNKFINSIAQSAGASVNVSYKVDDAYFKRANLNIALEKHEFDKQKHQLGIAKHNLEVQKLQFEIGALDPTSTQSVTASAGDETLQTEINYMDNIATAKQGYETEITGVIDNVYSNSKTPASTKQEYENILEKSYGYSPNGEVVDRQLASKTSLAEAKLQAYKASGLNRVDPNANASIVASEAGYDSIVADYNSEVGRAARKIINREGAINTAMATMQDIESISDSSIATELVKEVEDFILRVDAGVKTDSKGSLIDIPTGKRTNTTTALMKALKMASNEQLADFTSTANKARKSSTTWGAFFQGNWTDNDLGTLTMKEVNNSSTVKERLSNQILTTSSEAQVKHLKGLIPNNTQSPLIDDKQNISWYKDGENIVVVQNKGFTDNSKGGYANKPVRITLGKGDAAYNYLNNLSGNHNANRALDASVATMPIIGGSSSFLPATDNRSVGKQNTYLQGNPTINSYRAVGAIRNALEMYTTVNSAMDTVIKDLSRFYPGEQGMINDLANTIVTKAPTLNIKAEPADGAWWFVITQPNGQEVLNKRATSGSTLDPGMVDLLKNYPSQIIMDALLGEAAQDPVEILNVLNGTTR